MSGIARRRVLLVSNVPSPFLVELAEEVGRRELGWKLDIWFGAGLPPHRGRHWLEGLESKYVYCGKQEVAVRQEQVCSLEDLTAREDYTVILSLLPLHPKPVSLLGRGTKGGKIPVIFWHEPPLRRGAMIQILKRAIYRILARRLPIIACFAIGHLAAEEWAPVLRKPVFLVPYLQDLVAAQQALKAVIPKEGSVVRFVFSGQLIERNNVPAVLSAIDILNRQGYSDRYRIVFFGDGPLRQRVEAYASSVLGANLTLRSNHPASWGGRLDPLKECDVLLYPGIYSGWGLTVPETLALGKPVISTRGIESARFFVKDGLNGFLVDPDPENIVRAMKYFIENPESRAHMAAYCRESAMLGDVTVGAGAITELLGYLGLMGNGSGTSEIEIPSGGHT